jgi:hypothetical protein
MKPFLHRMLHAGVIASAVCKRIWEGFELLFRSKAEVARRASGRFEALKRREMEIERLDRLRNPGDYRGR